MKAAIFESADELRAAVGRTFGPTDWLPIGQSRIDDFARATDDHQWIHVDPERSARGPFGATVAHGQLTLALVGSFLPQLIVVQGMKMTVNYGCDRVRFPAVVRTGARVRARAEIIETQEVQGALRAKFRVTVEVENEGKPACVAEILAQYYF